MRDEEQGGSGMPLRFLDAGDRALVVELGDTIDAAINESVIALDDRLQDSGLAGIVETIPTYRSLLVQFDPALLPRAALKAHIIGLWPPPPRPVARLRLWTVPVCYGGPHGEDLPAVAARHGLTEADVVALHSGATYRVYMIGFAPGFTYLGGGPPALFTDRRTDPRPKTPAGTISIGGRQAAISPPLELPSGWHLLGRTPVRSYDPERGGRVFLFAPGDRVRFVPISADDFDALSHRAEAGEIVAECVEGADIVVDADG